MAIYDLCYFELLAHPASLESEDDNIAVDQQQMGRYTIHLLFSLWNSVKQYLISRKDDALRTLTDKETECGEAIYWRSMLGNHHLGVLRACPP